MKGADIISRLRVVLNDDGEQGWTDQELIQWINDGCLFIAVLRPDATAVNATVNLVAGSKQSIASLDPPGLQLLDVVRAPTAGRAIRRVDRDQLDTSAPGWHSAIQATPRCYTFDPLDPKTYYVYPPALVGTPIEIVYSCMPVVVTAENLATLTLSPDDLFLDPLVNYVLHRAYSKDSDHAKNAELSAGYRQLAEMLLVGKKGA